MRLKYSAFQNVLGARAGRRCGAEIILEHRQNGSSTERQGEPSSLHFSLRRIGELLDHERVEHDTGLFSISARTPSSCFCDRTRG